jgi:hypothetical protein
MRTKLKHAHLRKTTRHVSETRASHFRDELVRIDESQARVHTKTHTPHLRDTQTHEQKYSCTNTAIYFFAKNVNS